MPLLDHFTPPVALRKRWESFHSYWAVAIGTHLNDTLPERYHASVQQHHGSRIEADVLEYDLGPKHEANGSSGGIAVQTYAPPKTTGVLPGTFPDEIEIRIVNVEDSENLVAVIELVSPSNKESPSSRGAFAGKCASYLANGIGLIVVDPVIHKYFNLHDELIDLLHHPQEFKMAADIVSYAAAYRPIRREQTNQIDFWTQPLTIGAPLPMLPLALKGQGCIPIDLEETYVATCHNNHLA
jgi:hypothetical protein